MVEMVQDIMCIVFAESEIISLIAENKEKCDIIHGLNNSIASKIVSLVNTVGKRGDYMITGGVAKNLGVTTTLEKNLKVKYLYVMNLRYVSL